jgi:putative addiction module component (TIGR02574 family)
MSLEQLESALQSLSPKERRSFIHWIDDHRGELLAGANPAIEESWKQETRRRITEIESGAVKGIPGETVTANIRGLVGR